jgi:glutamyl-tRNA synthetase
MQKADNITISKQFSSLLDQKNIKTTINIDKVVGLLKERASFLADFWELGGFFFEAPQSFDEKAAKKAWKEDTTALMTELVELINEVSDFTDENVTSSIKNWITSKEIGFGKVMMPLRLCLVGSLQGPDVFVIAAMLGKEETIARIEAAIKKLS